jgi:glucose/arabinose dehydrogenase
MSERVGAIAEINGKTLKRQNLSLTKPVYASGEGGLLGFVLAPDFSISHRAYIYHTSSKIDDRLLLLSNIE